MDMRFYCDLYVSEELEEKKEKIIKKLQANKLQPYVYVITLSQGEQNHLEFYSSLLYKQRMYEEASVFVVGLAAGYDDALYLVETIVQDIYNKSSSVSIRSFILERQREYEEGRV